MPYIIPAILATNEAEYNDKLQKLEQTPELEGSWVQIDLMDDLFVQNSSIGPATIAKYKSSFHLEAHLMVKYPDNWIDDLLQAGVERIIFPIEDSAGIEERIEHILNHKIQVGLALNPETEVAKLTPFVSKIDVVLVMSVHPGFGGQPFIPESVSRIKEISQLRSKEQAPFLIEVDGGVSEVNAKELVQAGADGLVIGSHILEGDISENVENTWESISS